MKKTLLALSLAAVPSLASADTFLGVYAGIGQWYLTLEGDVGDSGSTTTLDDLGIDNETSLEMWLNFEHPIPIIPNLRLMHSAITVQEYSTTTQQFTLGGAVIDAQVEVYTDMDLSHTDATLYYELLDNWISIDVGVTARQIDGYVQVISEIEGQEGRAELNGVIPMFYVKAQFDLPLTGWSLGGYGNAVSYRGDNLTDFAVNVGYDFELIPLLDIGVNLGYRNFSLETDQIDDLFADATMSGFYAELQVHF